MKRNSLLQAALISGLLAACAGPTGSQADALSEHDIQDVRAEVEATLAEYRNAVNRSDWETVKELYLDDPRFHWVEDGRLAYSSQADVIAALDTVYPSVESAHYESVELIITPLTRDLAQVSTRYIQDLVLTSGSKLELVGAITILMHRASGGWGFLMGHSSTTRDRQPMG